ncbi:MAG: CheR family methyltransferase [Planctomycetota bacterium]
MTDEADPIDDDEPLADADLDPALDWSVEEGGLGIAPPTAIPLIVGVGASAGGLEPIESFFSRVPTGTGISYILVQHLSPDFKSFMKELLSRQTALKVARAEDGMEVEPDTVYLIPPKKILRYSQGCLTIADQDPEQRPNFPIDELFASLGEELGERAVAVVLSGTGSDGSRGIASVSAGGGLVLVQDPESAQFDGMPRAAITTGAAHFVSTPGELARIVADHAREIESGGLFEDVTAMPAGGALLSRVVGLIRRHCDLNLAHYKPGTLLRRISRRMLTAGHTKPEDYIALLEESEEERGLLRDDLLIGVTRFFRDSGMWSVLRREVFPELVADSRESHELRAWVAGCSSGEEVYTLAMLLDSTVRELGLDVKIKIFATDIDKRGLEAAARAHYPESMVNYVPEEYREQYIQLSGAEYRVSQGLRESVIFAQHDMTRDAPFTRMDLICCRNVLIYMQPTLQQQVLESMQFALRAGGVLVLGSSESLGKLDDNFESVDRRQKVFRRLAGRTVPGRQRRTGMGGGLAPWSPASRLSRRHAQADEGMLEATLRAVMAETASVCVVVNEQQELVRAVGDVGRFLRVPEGGRTISLPKMLREPLSIPVSSAIHRVLGKEESTRLDGISVGSEAIAIVAYRLRLERGASPLVAVVIREAPSNSALEAVDVSSIDELAADRIRSLEHDLQQSRESLQATIEELETTNEEQQATNEELLAANEELQGTNEELQSVNEELYTVNSEYQSKIDELTRANADIDNLLASAMVATIFVDMQMRILRFTPSSTLVFNLLPHDIGRPLRDISSKAVGVDLPALTQRVLDEGERVHAACESSDGRKVAVGIQPYVSASKLREGAILNFFDVTGLGDSGD